MTGLINRRLSEIAPEEIAALVRFSHQERSQAARDLIAGVIALGVGWFARLIREAGMAAQMGEAPKPYPARAYPRTRLCG